MQGTLLIEAYSCNVWVNETLDIQKDPKVILVADWVVVKSKDTVIREIKYLISKTKLKGHRVYSWDPHITKPYMRQCSHLVLFKGVLYRWVTPSKADQKALQLVIPQSYQKKALQGCHDDIWHMGLRWMLDLLWDWFYWPGITKVVELHIGRCKGCIWFKSKAQKGAIENIWATHLLQLVHLDYLTFKAT